MSVRVPPPPPRTRRRSRRVVGVGIAAVACVVLALGVLSRSGSSSSNGPRLQAASVAAPAAPAASGAATPGSSPGVTREPAAAVTAWSLADAATNRLAHTWRPRSGAYAAMSVRTNAMMLEIFANAARVGHHGAARNDARAQRLVHLLTTPPVFVCRTELARSAANFPHVPAFAAACMGHGEHSPLHPSADAIVARALLAAWEARRELGLDARHRTLIRHVLGAVATGAFYRHGTRAENQINWNADVLMADFLINGRRSALPRYRAQLLWFAKYMAVPAHAGRATNTSPGGALHYWLESPGGAPHNRVGTGEYANIVRSALGWYGIARRAGMAALPNWALARLRRWSGQVVIGTWTHAGYLNWDTGLAARRKHLRQYWGLALDSLVRGTRVGAIGATPELRRLTSLIATNGFALFTSTAWDGTGRLPAATSFGAPDGFPEASSNHITSPLRFILAELDRERLLAGVSPKGPALMASHDAQAGRLAVSTHRYNTAILQAGPTNEGGLEPTRLFDGIQRPLTLLMTDGLVGPALDLRLTARGRVVVDTQPGHDHSIGPAPAFTVPGARKNRAISGASAVAWGAVGANGARVSVIQHFTPGAIATDYRMWAGPADRFVVRLPVWDRRSTITPAAGATRGWHRTSGPLRLEVVTRQGARMTVTYRGLPRALGLRVIRGAGRGSAPAGTRTLVITGRASALRTLSRTLTIAPAA